jgi:Fic family protein
MLLRENLQKILTDKLKKLNELRPLSPELVIKLKEKFEIEMTYNSNAIEGNTLTLKETALVLQHGITVKGKPLKDHLEAKNHKEALEFLYDLVDQNERFTFGEYMIKSLHALVEKESNASISGKYREVDVFIIGSDHTPPSALDVPSEMKDLVQWANDNFKKVDIIEFSAILHHKFVHIHPFNDGNGRTGRLIMNIFLMHYGFPLVIIQKNDRLKYYNALSLADVGKYEMLVNFVGQSVLRSLNLYLDTLTPVKEKEKWITLAEAAKPYTYSQAYLSKLAKEGRIDAHKQGRNWVTTKEAMERYVKSLKKFD